MGAYREQLLREQYGKNIREPWAGEQEVPGGSFALFKLKFGISLLLFAGFAYLGISGNSFFGLTAKQIAQEVTEGELSGQISELGLYEMLDEW